MTADGPIDQVPPYADVLIEQAHGPIVAGDGNQYNFFPAAARRRRRGPLALDEESEDDLARHFIEPPGWAEVTGRLAAPGVVLLQGRPGSGRGAAARRLLGLHRPATGPIRVLPATADVDTERVLDPDDVTDGDRLLLDLSGLDVRRYEAVQSELDGFRTVVRERSSFLVVVLPTDLDRALRSDLRHRVVAVRRPDGLTVLRRHLAVHGVTEEMPDSVPQRLGDLLHQGSMEDLARLAWLIAAARRSKGDRPFVECVAEAVTAVTRHDEAIAEQVGQDADGRRRALLLTVGLFAGRSADVVFKAESVLLHSIGLAVDGTHDLERPDFGARLADLGATVEGGRVAFTGPGYDEAVRRRFWGHFPALREGFSEWVIGCGGLLRADPDPEELLARFAGACYQVDRSGDVARAIERWVTAPGTGPLAVLALRHGLTDSRAAASFRRRCYDWSVNRGLDSNLAHLVVAACEQVIARGQPGQAVVRLHHLVRHSDEDVGKAARDALVRLAEQNSLFLRRILTRLTEDGHDRLRGARDRALFLTVADPHLLLGSGASQRPPMADPVVRVQLVVGWRAVLQCEPAVEYEELVRAWLAAYAAHPAGGSLLRVLVEACGGAVRPLATLFAIGRRWWAEPDSERARRPVVLHLEYLIDAVRSRPRPSRNEATGP